MFLKNAGLTLSWHTITCNVNFKTNQLLQLLFLKNRCNVDRMRLLRKPLPLVGYEDVWMRIHKIIGKHKFIFLFVFMYIYR